MKRFQSRIESLRRVRQQAEQLARLTAAVRQGEKAAATQKADQLSLHIEDLLQQGTTELARGNTAVIQALSATTRRAQNKLAAAQVEVQQADERLVQAVQEVAAAKSEVQIADKHRAKEFAEHRRQTLVDEENVRQENNGRRFASNATKRTAARETSKTEVAR